MIEPLVAADVDLRGLPFMPLDTVRLLDSDLFALSTGDEFKAAVALWCKSWTQVPAASVPNDDRVLAHLSGAGPRWKKVMPMALRGWTLCSDNRWYHPVVAEKALEAWSHRVAQRARANKRWQNQRDDDGNATADATALQTDATAYPVAMQGTGTGTGTVKANPPSGGSSDGAPPDRPPLALVGAPTGPPPCPHQQIVDAYHRILPTLARVTSMSATRKSHLGARWREKRKRQSVDWWERLFTFVAASPFLLGDKPERNGKAAWRVSFVWLIKSEENLLKVIEGNYHEDQA